MATETRTEMPDYINTRVNEGRQSAEKTENCLPGGKMYKVIGISFGLLCIIQFTLNVVLHLRGTGVCNKLDFDYIDSTNGTLMSPEVLDGNAVQNFRGCPVGWLEYKSSCYQFTDERNDWEYASDDCEAKRAHLAILDDADKMDFLGMFKDRLTVWIGLRSQQDGPLTAWTWVDGRQYTYRNNDNWLQSSHQSLNCAYADQHPILHLVPASCQEQHGWLCEKELK
ncbi:snaclec A10-like [Scomber scombrus]|uniref:Snaclec A10-like n=1 Tax=Scomber scombrus TaxID=13677 RepID=A0AAV1P876_SCOSC